MKLLLEYFEGKAKYSAILFTLWDPICFTVITMSVRYVRILTTMIHRYTPHTEWHPCNENQLDALFILSLFRQNLRVFVRASSMIWGERETN